MKSATDMPQLALHREAALQAEYVDPQGLIWLHGCGECPQRDDVKLGRMAADRATACVAGEPTDCSVSYSRHAGRDGLGEMGSGMMGPYSGQRAIPLSPPASVRAGSSSRQ